MDIFKFKEDVINKLNEMNTEEFYKVLKKAGVDCKLVKNNKYKSLKKHLKKEK